MFPPAHFKPRSEQRPYSTHHYAPITQLQHSNKTLLQRSEQRPPGTTKRMDVVGLTKPNRFYSVSQHCSGSSKGYFF